MHDEPGRRELVRRCDGPASPAATEADVQTWRAEHLVVPGTAHLHFQALPSDDDIAHQMARRVALDPTDARVHVERVNHHLIRRDGESAYGALLDLYLAFGPSAAGLRSRLLNGARQLIGPQRAAALDGATGSGLAPWMPAPPSPMSMLSAGVTGSTDIVRRRSQIAVAR